MEYKTIPLHLCRTDEEWRKHLTPSEYRVLRARGTEMAFTGRYWKYSEEGIYVCAGCGLPLFDSEDKFESNSGWPCFRQAITGDRIAEHLDLSYGLHRIEVQCACCGGHLGHVFPDGPPPEGLRYCVNSIALRFQPRAEASP